MGCLSMIFASLLGLSSHSGMWRTIRSKPTPLSHGIAPLIVVTTHAELSALIDLDASSYESSTFRDRNWPRFQLTTESHSGDNAVVLAQQCWFRRTRRGTAAGKTTQPLFPKSLVLAPLAPKDCHCFLDSVTTLMSFSLVVHDPSPEHSCGDVKPHSFWQLTGAQNHSDEARGSAGSSWLKCAAFWLW